MSEDVENIIARKLETARTVSAPLPKITDILDKYAKNTEKGARSYIGCIVESMILDSEIRKFSDILDEISMPAMIAIVSIQGVDRAALINIDLDLVYHVVDLRMGGSPTELPEFAARRPTSIDWNMCLPLVSIALNGFSEAVSDTFNITEEADRISMECTGYEHQPMLANITSDHSDCLFVRMAMDIGEAARSGNFDLIIPLSSLDSMKSRVQKNSSVQSANGDAWAEHMINVVLDTEMELYPVLQSSLFSVAELSRLEIGQVLPLDEDAHQQMKIMLDGQAAPISIANGRLGAFKSHKALKLIGQPDREFFEPMRDAVTTILAQKEA